MSKHSWGSISQHFCGYSNEAFSGSAEVCGCGSGRLGENYTALQAAIIEQASADYTDALKNKDSRMVYDCESFFRSRWGDYLTLGHGWDIVLRLRKEAKNRHQGRKR